MLWKILSGLSAVALGVGVWFAYQNQAVLREELAQKSRAEQNLQDVKKAQVTAANVMEREKKKLADLTKQRDDTRVEVASINSTIETKQREVDEMKKSLEEAQAKLAKIKDDIRKAGDIKKLLAEIEELKKQLQASEAAVANQEQQLALTTDKLTGVNNQVAKLKEIDSKQRRGQIEPDFKARVAQPFPAFGFVVLNKGNSGGVYANNLLEVKRGKEVIAKLRVRDVEQGTSVADLVPGSLAQGESIQPGDIVVAAPRPPEPAATSAPAQPAPSPAPATPPAGGGAPPDPFGGSVTPTPGKPTTADPFAN